MGKCVQYKMKFNTDSNSIIRLKIMNNKMSKKNNMNTTTTTNPNLNNNLLTNSNNNNSIKTNKMILTNSMTFNLRKWMTPWCPTNHNLKIDILLNNIIILILSKHIIIKKIKSILKIWSITNILVLLGQKAIYNKNTNIRISHNRISNTLIINNNNSRLKSNNHNNNINVNQNNKNNQILMNLMTWSLREWMIQWSVINHNLKIDLF